MANSTTFRSLKNTSLIIILIMSVFTSCTKESLEEGVNLTTADAHNMVAIEQELLVLINEHRDALGHNALAFNEVAYAYANDHTNYMMAEGTLSHDNYNTRATKMANEVGANHVGENVAKNYNSAEEALEKWLESSNHKKTIEGDFSFTGISVKEDDNGNIYYTQIFYQ
ncbi:MAG: serine protease [Flavobacteriaceae bacterium]|nr:MAG: serine protease [Flavobacteriaceae bacterium]